MHSTDAEDAGNSSRRCRFWDWEPWAAQHTSQVDMVLDKRAITQTEPWLAGCKI